jgi:serine/threonine protein phosphatase PrpC
VHLFGICDGHGQYGREVSSYIKIALSAQIDKNYGHEYKPKQIEIFDKERPADIKDPHKTIRMCLRDCFLKVNQDVADNTPNCQFSGTTCSIVVARGPQIVSANSGDSRAIMVDYRGSVKQLSRDHKPDCQDEKKRIIEKNGRVRPLLNHQQGGIEVGPARVWLQDVEVPGLAMSRSLGDYVAQSVGVSPEPGKFKKFLKFLP